MRLHNYLKNNAHLTKSELMVLYNNNEILVNEKIESLVYEVSDSDIITVKGVRVEAVPIVYYLYNKPIGVTCTNSSDKENSLNDLPIKEKIFSVGRLDKDSHGLLILTNDGKLSDSLLNPIKHVEKEYIVKVSKDLDDEFIYKMTKGVDIGGYITKPCEAKLIDTRTFSIILTEGKNRQIRKMTKACGNYVVDLERVRIGNIKLGNLSLGEIRKVEEIKA